MAAAKKSTAKAAAGTQMVKWDEELAKYADKSSSQEDTAESGGGMKWFSTKSGVLSFDDEPLPGNRMLAVILDGVFEHVYYEGKFDANNPSPPTCFAFGRDEGELAPHKDVVERDQAQADRCSECEFNKFGSADTGRGKACRNIRRLALLPGGTIKKDGKISIFKDADHYAEAGMGFMKIPVTSTTAYKAYVKSLGQSLRKPTFAVVTEISIVPDATTQFAVKFNAIEELPFECLDAIFKRVQEAEAIIESPYNLDVEEEAPRARGRGAAAKPAKGKTARPGAQKAAPAAAKRGGRKY